MNGSIAVRDVMNREYVGVSEGDPIAGAAGLMREEGVDAAVVLRGSEPVGVLDAVDVVSVVAEGLDPETTTVEEAMGRPATSIEVDRPLPEAVAAMAAGERRRLVVTHRDEVVGCLGEGDVVAALATLPGVTAEPDATVDPGAVDAAAAAGLERELYTTHGLCEVCGSLARDLTDHNGQLVCADCREM